MFKLVTRDNHHRSRNGVFVVHHTVDLSVHIVYVCGEPD